MKKLSILLICLFLLPVMPIQGAAETFINGDFASVDGHMPTGWSIGYGSSAVVGENIQVLENKYNGKNALRLYDPNSTGTAHYKHMTVTQTLRNLVPGAEYAITGYSKMITKGTSQGGVIKISVGGEESDVTAYYSALNVWEKQILRFTVPDNASAASVLLRLVGGGEILWADMKLTCIKKYISTLETDAIFYYTDQTEGIARLKANPNLSEAVVGGSVLFTVEDAENTLWQQSITLSNGEVEIKFPLSVLSTEKKAYTLRATLRDAGGVILENCTQSVYRYKRPEMIASDGTIKVQGEEIRPVFAYHVRQKHYKVCAEAGINVVQNAMHSTVEGYVDMLNGALDETGKPIVYMLLPLYNGMCPAGHPANISLTKEVAQSAAIRNHPAFFGYIVMDEPFLNMKHPEEYLEKAYTAIRAYDDVHPVFIMENYPEKYRVSAKYADILGADIYAGVTDGTPPVSAYVTQNAAMGREAAGEKPFWVLLQTFDYQDYFPTAVELRGQIYQAALAGADAVGFYKIEKALGGKDLCNMPMIWDLISSLCTNGEYAVLTEKQSFITSESQNFIARRWERKDKQYVQVINRTMEEQTAEIPLGKLQSGIYEAVILYGDASKAKVDLNGSILRVTLPAAAAATITNEYTDAVCYAVDHGSGEYVSDVSGGQTVDIVINGGLLNMTAGHLQFFTTFYADGSAPELCGIRFYTKEKEESIRIENVKVPSDADEMQVYIRGERLDFYRLLKIS